MKMTGKFGKGQTLSALEKCGFEFENKKNNFKKYTPLVGALLLALVAFFFASVLPVSAAESAIVDGVYQYSWTVHYTSIDKESAESTSGATEQYIVKCDKPFNIYAFNYYNTYFVGNEERTDTICEFFILPDGEASETGLQYSSDGGATWKTYDYKTRQVGNGSSAYYVPCYFNSFYRIKNDASSTLYILGESNMRSMHVEAWTDINGIMTEIVAGNKDAYEENYGVPEVEDYEKLYLKGFTCDNTIQASWTGLLTDLDRVNYSKVYVEVEPLYLVVVEDGQEYIPYSGPGTITVPYNDFSFYEPFENYFVDCPYEQCALFLDFTPIYEFSDTLTLKGQPTTMEFDFDGSLEVVFPSGSLVEEFDPICMFNGAYLNQKGDEYYMFGWDDVSSRHVESEILTTDVKIEIFDNTGVAHVYEPEDFNWSQRFIKLDANQILAFLKAEGVDDWAVISEIRFTPYYTTATCKHYGRSTLATFENSRDFSELLISNGDAFDSESSLGYAPSPTSPPIEIETVIPDVTVDTEWNLDTMTENFFVMLTNLVTYCGQVPTLVSQVFSFLPSVYGSLIVIALSVCIILRILGR